MRWSSVFGKIKNQSLFYDEPKNEKSPVPTSVIEGRSRAFLHNSYQNILKDIRDLVRIDVSAMNFNILPIRDSDIHIPLKVFIGNN